MRNNDIAIFAAKRQDNIKSNSSQICKEIVGKINGCFMREHLYVGHTVNLHPALELWLLIIFLDSRSLNGVNNGAGVMGIDFEFNYFESLMNTLNNHFLNLNR